MALRTKLKWTAIVIAVIFIGLQFTTPRHTNPPFDEAQTLQGMTTVPPEVSAVFARSCNDCHSNKTNWRWYTYVAPVSWFTVGHVNKGRAELNLSEWGRYGRRMKETRLKAICTQCQGGTMPLASYAFVHREVRLSPEEVKMICEWSENARKQLEATPSNAGCFPYRIFSCENLQISSASQVEFPIEKFKVPGRDKLLKCAVEQGFAAAGGIACFSSNLFHSA